jgi:hypothetical protein
MVARTTKSGRDAAIEGRPSPPARVEEGGRFVDALGR